MYRHVWADQKGKSTDTTEMYPRKVMRIIGR